MILGAGLGIRMRPLSDLLPKPLIELDGQVLIDHVLDRLSDAGVEKAVVNVHHLADQMEAHLAQRAKPKIIISDERDLLMETGGGVKKALSELEGEEFFIHNSDSVWIERGGATLRRMADAWDPQAMDSLLLVAPTATSIGYNGHGDFELFPDGCLARRRKNGIAPFVFAGVSIAGSELFDDTPEGAFSLNLLWDRALEAGRIYGLAHEGVWMHVGTPEALNEAAAVLKASQAPNA